MKFLFYTDSHLAGQNPRFRIDDYPQAIINKVQEVYCLAEKHNVDAVLFGGDFFHTHKIFSYHIITKIIRTINASSKKTYAIVGQHDLVGHNKDTYKTSALCFIDEHCPLWTTLWSPVDLGDVILYPCHCFDALEPLLVKNTSKKSILMVHHLLTNSWKPFETYDINKLSCSHDVVLCGDLHCGIPISKIGNTIYANPGALARHSISEIERPVQVVLVDTSSNDVSYLKLDIAQPGEEVFGKNFLTKVKEGFDVDVSRFVNSLTELSQGNSSIEDLIEKNRDSSALSKDTYLYLKQKIQEVSSRNDV